MSRTYKDRPYWVRVNDPGNRDRHPVHNCIPGHRECDLEAGGSARSNGWCYWTEHYSRYFTSPPRWFINHRWNAPDRMRSRIACDRYRDEWIRYRDSDVVVPVDYHHHGATRDWT